MITYIYAFISIFIVSLISFIGAVFLILKKDKLEKLVVLLVALSAGTLLGDAFLHLLPEMAEKSQSNMASWLFVIAGIIVFFALEKIICWHHCHIPETAEHHHPMGMMNMLGGAIHNFIDGVIIAGSYMISAPIGIATTIAVMAHEIPQKFTHVGVLLYSGYSRGQALLYNFASALTSFFGALIIIAFGKNTENLIAYIIPFTAGGFIYIAAVDLIPELHKETNPKKSLKQLLVILIGIGVMWIMKALIG